jgi:hypothetical protein
VARTFIDCQWKIFGFMAHSNVAILLIAIYAVSP